MLLTAILAVASMLFVGCSSPEITPAQRRELLAQPTLTPEQRREILARTTGTIVGTVRESGTKRALEGVFVTAQYFGDLTKADGRCESAGRRARGAGNNGESIRRPRAAGVL